MKEKQEDFTIESIDMWAQNRLANFLPDKIFDAHTHIYDCSFLPHYGAPGSIFRRAGDIVGGKEYYAMQAPLYGENKQIYANFIIMPDSGMTDLPSKNRARSTSFLKEQLELYPNCVGEVVVLPEDSISDIEAQLVHPRIVGLKCYHCMVKGRVQTADADIGEFLPESAWQVAEKRGLSITLHMVKDASLSDKENLNYIQRMAKNYSHATLILAHCARGFAAWTAIDSLSRLKDLPNVWFDIAAVCESPAIFETIRTCGVKRVLWGSDFPISMQRGKCVSVGRESVWLDSPRLSEISAGLVGTEALLAFQQAAHMLKLSKKDIEDIFYYNAVRLFRYEID